MKKVGILRFLGTNCDRDAWQAVAAVDLQPEWLWYQDQFNVNDYSALIVPGGFSYGDYLRCGALAAKSVVMKSVHEANDKGVPILGICNGFQILCDAGLLPGALVQNEGRRFIDEWVDLELKNPNPNFSNNKRSSAKIPIAHMEGRYYIEEDNLKDLFDNEQVWWTYSSNPNGSVGNIAGVMNKNKNVAALMPHPERAIFDWMGGSDGLSFFETIGS